MKHLFDNVVVDSVVGLLLPLIIMLSSDCFLFHISITASMLPTLIYYNVLLS